MPAKGVAGDSGTLKSGAVEPFPGCANTRWLEDCDFQLYGSVARHYSA
jgi:hypothetical protein